MISLRTSQIQKELLGVPQRHPGTSVMPLSEYRFKLLYLCAQDRFEEVMSTIRDIITPDKKDLEEYMYTLVGYDRITGPVKLTRKPARSVITLNGKDFFEDDKHREVKALRERAEKLLVLDKWERFVAEIDPDAKYKLYKGTGESYRISFFSHGARKQVNVGKLLVLAGNPVPQLAEADPRKTRTDKMSFPLPDSLLSFIYTNLVKCG